MPMTIRRRFFDTTPPSVPGSVAAVALNDTTIRVSWVASSDTGTGVQAYNVYWSITANGAYLLLATVQAGTLLFDDMGLAPGSTRHYKVTALDRTPNESAMSSSASSTTTGGGQFSVSESNGYLVIDSGLGGAGEINFGLPWPFLNSDGTWMQDLWSFKITVTTLGGAPVVNQLDTYTTGLIQLASRIRVIGLTPLQSYRTHARAVDEPGNEGIDSDDLVLVATVWTPPVRNYVAIPVNKSITVAGDYQMPGDMIGPISINVGNVYLNGNGKKKIAHSGGVAGVQIASGLANVIVDDVEFDPSGTGPNILLNGNLGLNCAFLRSAFKVINNSGISGGSNQRSLNGAEISGCSLDCRYPGPDPDETKTMVSLCTDFVAYDNDVACNSVGNRSGGFGMCGAYQSWRTRFTTTGACNQATVHTSFGMPTCVIHDEVWTPGANSTTQRLCNFDGSDNVGTYTPIDTIRHVLRHVTVDFRAAGLSGPAVRIRNPIGPVSIGNLLVRGASTDAPNISLGDNDDGQAGTHPNDTPYGAVMFRNTTPEGTGRPFLHYGPWRNTLISFRNNITGQSSGDGAGNWDSNEDTFETPFQKVGTPLWRASLLTAPSTTGFAISVGWIGWNPASDVPQKMGVPFAVTRYR